MTKVTPSSHERSAVLVVGMHRSGTSAVTRIIGLLGARLPATLLPANEFNQLGYWESNIITDLHDELLASAGSSWLDLAPFPQSWFGSQREREFRGRIREALESEFGSAERFVIKDPRIGKFIPVWLSVLQEMEVEPLFVVPYRHPFEVAASLEERDKLSLTHSLLLWLEHAAEVEFQTRHHRRALVPYHGLLEDWRGQMATVAETLEIEWSTSIAAAESEIDRFLSVRHRHHASARDDLTGMGPSGLFDLVRQTYEMLQGRGFGKNGRRVWNDIRAQVTALLDSNELPLPDTKVLLALHREASELRARGAELESELARLTERLAARDEEVQGIAEVNLQARQEIMGLSGRLAESDAALRSVLASKSWRLTGPLRSSIAAVRQAFASLARWALQRAEGSRSVRESMKGAIKRAVYRSPKLIRDPVLRTVRAVREQKATAVAGGDPLEYALPWILDELGTGAKSEDESKFAVPDTDVKLVAFYLPQFHPFPENDEFWGKGFTEWANTSRARPEFEGHYQPRTPAELGFYDLRLAQVQERQIALARQHGIHGFCYHHYWFSGRRLMRVPLERHLERPDFDFPFCLHWANEPWTASWDGLEGSRTLLGQDHSPEDDLAFIRDIEPALRDERYIRVDGKPLFLLYRPGLFPDIRATVDRWQEHCVRAGIGELHLAVLQQGFDGAVDPRDLGFDAAVEFPPHNITLVDARSAVKLSDPDYPGTILSYPDMVRGSLARGASDYPLYRGLVPAWDCTARRRAATLFVGSTPDLYREWLEGLCLYARAHLPRDERFVFINAWNEWAEGAYLEPDTKYGYAYLNRTGEVMRSLATTPAAPEAARKIVVVGHDAVRLGAQNLLLHIVRWLSKRTATELRIVLGQGGDLVSEYKKVADVLVLEEVRAAQGSPGEVERAIEQFVGDDVDLVFANSAASGQYLPLLEFINAPIITYVHELEESLKRFCTRESVDGFIKASTKVISSSTAVERNLRDRHGVTAEQSEMVCSFIEYGGVAADTTERARLRQSLGLAPSTVAVFGCGTRDWRKGPDIFVEVAARLRKRGVDDFHHFWIGPAIPGEYDDLESSLSQRGLADYVTFLGPQPDCRFFGAGDFFLLSSREDPSPLVCSLAAECRMPTLCFADSGGAPDFVGDSGGVVVPYEDVEALTEAAAELIKDRKKRETLGLGAEQRLLEGYTADARMPELFHIMRSVAGSPPVVSVVIPSYNYAQYLDRRMSSVLEQTFQDFEIIVEDDGSTDGTVEALERFRARRNVRVVTHRENAGAFAMWLAGMGAASADIIWIAEADDYCEPQLLETLVPFVRDRRVKLAYAQSNVVDEDDNPLGDYSRCFPELSETKWLSSYVVSGDQELADGLAVKNTIVNASAVLFRKPSLDVVEAILREFKLSGDWYLYLNIIKDGYVAYSPKKLNYHRRHQKSIIAKYGDKGVALAELGRIHSFLLDEHHLDQALVEKMVGYAFEIWSKENPGCEVEEFWAQYGLDLSAAGRGSVRAHLDERMRSKIASSV